MSDTKFTKGPYRVGADMESICLNRGTDEDYTSNGWAKKLAKVHWKQSWMEAEEAFANAKLFAAAPELYEALNVLVKLNDDSGPFGGELYHDRVDRAWNTALEALSKARGES